MTESLEPYNGSKAYFNQVFSYFAQFLDHIWCSTYLKSKNQRWKIMKKMAKKNEKKFYEENLSAMVQFMEIQFCFYNQFFRSDYFRLNRNHPYSYCLITFHNVHILSKSVSVLSFFCPLSLWWPRSLLVFNLGLDIG